MMLSLRTKVSMNPEKETETFFLFPDNGAAHSFSYVLPPTMKILNFRELLFPKSFSVLQCMLCLQSNGSSEADPGAPPTKSVSLQLVIPRVSKFKNLLVSKAPPEMHGDNYFRLMNHTSHLDPYFEFIFLMDVSKILYMKSQYTEEWHKHMKDNHLVFDIKGNGTIVDMCMDETPPEEERKDLPRVAILCRKDASEEEKFRVLLLNINDNDKKIKRGGTIEVSYLLSKEDRTADYSRILYCSKLNVCILLGLERHSSEPPSTFKPEFTQYSNIRYHYLNIIIFRINPQANAMNQQYQVLSKKVLCTFPPQDQASDQSKIYKNAIQIATNFKHSENKQQAFTAAIVVQNSSTIVTIELFQNQASACDLHVRQINLVKGIEENSFNSQSSGTPRDAIPITAMSNAPKNNEKNLQDLKNEPASSIYVCAHPNTILSCIFRSSQGRK